MRTLLGYWDFCGKNVNDVWYLLEWIAWDSFEFEKAGRTSRYSFSDPCAFNVRSYLLECTRLEVGEPLGIVDRFSITDAYFESGDTFDEVYNPVKTPLEGHIMCLCMRTFMTLVVILLSRILLIILMLPLFVHYPLFPPSITLMCSSIIP